MGIFGSREEVRIIDPGNVAVDARVAEVLPDSGEFLVTLLSPLHGESLDAVRAEIDRVRHPNGFIPSANLAGVGTHDWKSGPLTHLVWFTVADRITVGVWASLGLGRQDRRRVDTVAQQVLASQGLAAAATWALLSRPNGKLDLEFLAGQLLNSWEEWGGKITNGDVIKSFKKWRR